MIILSIKARWKAVQVEQTLWLHAMSKIIIMVGYPANNWLTLLLA